MPRKRRKGRQTKHKIANLETALCLNGRAIEEGPQKRYWSPHDLKQITPLTPAQEEMFHDWINTFNICAHGSAGTGKTFIAFYLALTEILAKRQDRIIVVRSAVPTREMGFLPGTLEEKMEQYELPYHSILWELLGRSSSYRDMKDAGLIEFHSTSFLRGLTWDNAVIIVDESENLTMHEIDSVMTRIGNNTRIILTGDTKQTDLDGRRGDEGLTAAMHAFDAMKSFSTVEFDIQDIVRGKTVKEWIIACTSFAA